MIVWSKSAYADLEKVAAFFKEQGNPELARKAVFYIGLTAERLARFPLTGRKGRVKGTRELSMPKIPYLMVYASGKPNKLKIVRVLAADGPWPDFPASPERVK
ncbi:MAG: type II toxin-antitoxin system RelE/ParE family toxin [Desulfovibrio sp.]|jgi:plasmid stabilization system protein ParE|nr:type II toxin-antitoxin system RelE/ParE family toxin [Desulfovibrio sp.]